MKMAVHSERLVSDRDDMERAFKKQVGDIQRLTTKVNDLELELRSARFEIGHSVLQETKKKEEISILQCEHRKIVTDLQSKLDEKERLHNEHLNHVLRETDKLSSLLSSIYSSASESNGYLEYKSCKQLLSAAAKVASSLRHYLTSVCGSAALSDKTLSRNSVARDVSD